MIRAVGSASTTAPHDAQAATCSHAPWGSSEVVFRRNGRHAATVMDTQARVLAVASVPARGNDWSPFVRITTRGAAIRFTTLDGTTVDCRIRPAD